MKQVSLFATGLIVVITGAVFINPVKANAQLIELGKDALSNWGNAIRSNTVGRLAGQEFIAYMSISEVDALKAQYGGDYHAKVTDWCNSKVVERVGSGRGIAVVPGVTSTWRVENDRVNCYWRKVGSN